VKAGPAYGLVENGTMVEGELWHPAPLQGTADRVESEDGRRHREPLK
jgi:hypothetical protein